MSGRYHRAAQESTPRVGSLSGSPHFGQQILCQIDTFGVKSVRCQRLNCAGGLPREKCVLSPLESWKVVKLALKGEWKSDNEDDSGKLRGEVPMRLEE